MLNDQQNTKSLVVGLLEHIGRGLDDATNLPDAGVMGKGIILFHSVPHFTLLCLVWSDLDGLVVQERWRMPKPSKRGI